MNNNTLSELDAFIAEIVMGTSVTWGTRRIEDVQD